MQGKKRTIEETECHWCGEFRFCIEIKYNMFEEYFSCDKCLDPVDDKDEKEELSKYIEKYELKHQ